MSKTADRVLGVHGLVIWLLRVSVIELDRSQYPQEK